MQIYTTEIRGTAEDVVRALEEESASLNLVVLQKTNMRTKLWSRGIPLEQDYWIVECFDPNLSKEVLSKSPELGLYLPGKMTLYPRLHSNHVEIHLFLPTQTADEKIASIRPWLRAGERKMMELIRRVQARL